MQLLVKRSLMNWKNKVVNNVNYSLADLAKLKIHFIGIGGAGMSGIARIMLAKGFAVSGSDKSDSAVLTSLRDSGQLFLLGTHQKISPILRL